MLNLSTLSLLVAFVGSSKYWIKSSANEDNLTFFFFLICICFIAFSCLIALATLSETLLNRRGKSGHSYLDTDFRGNAVHFSPFRMM